MVHYHYSIIRRVFSRMANRNRTTLRPWIIVFADKGGHRVHEATDNSTDERGLPTRADEIWGGKNTYIPWKASAICYALARVNVITIYIRHRLTDWRLKMLSNIRSYHCVGHARTITYSYHHVRARARQKRFYEIEEFSYKTIIHIKKSHDMTN